MENDITTQDLLNLKSEYEQDRLRLFNEKETLIQRKKEIYRLVVDIIKRNMNISNNDARLQKYLEKTSIKEFGFLFRGLVNSSSSNQKGSLAFQELLLLDNDVRNIALEHNIVSGNKLFKILSDYNFYHISHPFLENDKVKEIMKRASKLAYLDELFKDINNVLNYQGSYTVYSYLKGVLKELLKDGNPHTDRELIYNDYNQKLDFVLGNLSCIASYLLDLREQIPESRLALCNAGLSKVARKEAGTSITFNQKIFASAIAFGTTLERLEERNYEDAKGLIFIPHQKLLK